MFEIVRRACGSPPELTAELRRRGFFLPDERAELSECAAANPAPREPLGSVQFATLLAQADAHLAAAAVLRSVVTPEELRWVNRLVKLKKPSIKRDELIRIVERAIEGS